MYETVLAAEYEHFTGHVEYKYKIRERWKGHEKSAKNLRKCQEGQEHKEQRNFLKKRIKVTLETPRETKGGLGFLGYM